MEMLYTANGRYIRCCTEEGSRPVIIVCEKEYEVDVQEFIVWSILNWRILREEEIGSYYEKFHIDARSSCEKKVIRLARQTPLSCAEIIKCVEMDIHRLKDGYDVLDKLYDDNDLNCDNFAQAVREYHCSREVITAVANLYLRQQIMIDTY